MTVINQYSNQAEAFIDRGFLISRGIPAEVQGDALSELLPAPGSGTGSIYLIVPDQDAVRAARLLKDRKS